jgi:hypothetical protein
MVNKQPGLALLVLFSVSFFFILAYDFAVLQGVQAFLELEDRFRANKDHLAHANVLATKY